MLLSALARDASFCSGWCRDSSLVKVLNIKWSECSGMGETSLPLPAKAEVTSRRGEGRNDVKSWLMERSAVTCWLLDAMWLWPTPTVIVICRRPSQSKSLVDGEEPWGPSLVEEEWSVDGYGGKKSHFLPLEDCSYYRRYPHTHGHRGKTSWTQAEF